ncbi:hypothetical protein CALVIDRAFT_538490 [Calocera viscosa TUFC12733]|uniref:Uncharacterized protein n=1 Tax=Calocera viscosa (strain TUFC12733) TaxID=1330018 RepID=A0A167KUE6_CALVF|nr:hypothetical protein CALVIDRAFT_538490 [Calocera viscosa TUFC12733]
MQPPQVEHVVFAGPERLTSHQLEPPNHLRTETQHPQTPPLHPKPSPQTAREEGRPTRPAPCAGRPAPAPSRPAPFPNGGGADPESLFPSLGWGAALGLPRII